MSSFIYGSIVFTTCDYYFWIPIVAPIVGSLFGAVLYKVLVEQFLDEVDEPREYEGKGNYAEDLDQPSRLQTLDDRQTTHQDDSIN